MCNNITFIHVGNDEIDTYEIIDVSEINKVLEEIKSL